ncbi:MAG: hypothetical protein MJ238_03490 [Bacilli bacterium]|nr:hypothetical protein [Bacilli bacterium]
MKKSLTKKTIQGREYFYLCYRTKGKLTTKYLGTVDSPKYKKYLLSLTKSGATYGLRRSRIDNWKAGVPIAYIEDSYIVLEYKNGVKEYLDSKENVKKVVFPNG